MQNKCYKYEWRWRGRNKTRQTKGKEDKDSHLGVHVVLSCHVHNGSDKPAFPKRGHTPILLSGWVSMCCHTRLCPIPPAAMGRGCCTSEGKALGQQPARRQEWELPISPPRSAKSPHKELKEVDCRCGQSRGQDKPECERGKNLIRGFAAC